jgi:hypothetical protein
MIPSPTPSVEEDDARLEEVMAGLRVRALQQVQQYIAVLARMRKDLTPSARTRMIRGLASRPHPQNRESNPRRERAGTNMATEWDRMDHEQVGHHQGAEAKGPGGAVRGCAGEAGH